MLLPRDFWAKSGVSALGRAAALLCAAAACAFFASVSAARSVENATWNGGLLDSEWATRNNWRDTGSVLGGVPTDTATFTGGAWGHSVSISYGTTPTIKTIIFTEDAKKYDFNIGGILIPASLTVTGKGIINEGGRDNRPEFHVGGVLFGRGTLCFTNEASAGSAILSTNSKGKICFADKAKAGEAEINMESDSTLEFSGESSADKAEMNIAKGAQAVFKDSATAGNAAVTVDKDGKVDFKGDSSAQNAKLHIADGGKVGFSDNAAGDKADITVDKGGSVGFADKANAGKANINLKEGGNAVFDGKANAGDAKINAADGGKVDFIDSSGGGQADINVGAGGSAGFQDSTSAGKAKIKTVDGGVVEFKDVSTAADSNIEVKNGGKLNFDGKADGGNAKIIAVDDGSVSFSGDSTAGKSALKLGKDSAADFSGNASAGEAQIEVGADAKLNFRDNATGGKADVTMAEGGAMDLSGLSNDGMSLGSLNGKGAVTLGENSLNLGGNDKNSDFSGKISGNGGLGKDGGGTLTLSGENDFAGGVDIRSGSVDAKNTKALGTGDVSLQNGGNLNLGAAGDYPNRISIAEGQSGSLSVSKGIEASPKGIAVADGGKLDVGKEGDKNGGGTLTLNGENSSFGKNTNVSVNSGGLKLGDEKAGSLFDQEGSVLNIAKDGVVDVNGHNLSLNNLTGQGTITSNAEGEEGAVTLKSGDFGGKISDGKGKIGVNKIGDGTLRFTGDNDYSGKTDVRGGELKLEGNLKNSDVVVGSGARISGNGVVHGLRAEAGSTVSPGVSDKPGGGVGKLEVVGDSLFDKGSNLVIKQGKGGKNDQIVIKGDADIKGGNVAARGLLRPGDKMSNVISATGKLNGVFDGITPEFNTDFIKPVFEKTPNGISIIIVRNGMTLDNAARNSAEAKVGRGMETLPPTNPLMIQVLNSTKAESQQAMKQLSGQVYASTKMALMQSSNYLPGFINGRMDGTNKGSDAAANAAAPAQGGSFGYPSFETEGAAARAGNKGALLPAGNHAFGGGGAEIWTRVFSQWQDNNKSSPGVWGHEMDTTGTFIGLDAPLKQWLVGAALGYGYSAFRSKELVNYGHVNTLYSGLYAGRQFSRFNLRLGGQQNWSDVYTRRAVSFTRFDDFLKSKSHMRLSQLFAQAGMPLKLAQAQFEPFAGLSYTYLHNGKMQEHGGAAALSEKSGSQDYFSSVLGLRTSALLQQSGAQQAAVRGSIGWQHLYGSATPAADLAFAESQSFDTQGTPLARDAMALEAGLDFHFTKHTLFGISYTGQYAKRQSDNGIRFNFRTRY